MNANYDRDEFIMMNTGMGSGLFIHFIISTYEVEAL